MVDWLNEFAEKQASSKLSRKASSNRIIVNKAKFANVKDNDVVAFKGAKYKVVNSAYNDKKGAGVILEKIADLEGTPMDVAMGTAVDYTTNPDVSEQEYANVDPQVQDVDPRDAEVAKFTEEAEQTADEIEFENSTDGTTGFNYPNRIIQKIVEKYAPQFGYALVEETNIPEEINNEEAYEEPTEEDFVNTDTADWTDEFVENYEVEIPEFVDDEEYDDTVDYREEEETILETPNDEIEAKKLAKKANRISIKLKR